jgi:hypothetical protein
MNLKKAWIDSGLSHQITLKFRFINYKKNRNKSGFLRRDPRRGKPQRGQAPKWGGQEFVRPSISWASLAGGLPYTRSASRSVGMQPTRTK